MLPAKSAWIENAVVQAFASGTHVKQRISSPADFQVLEVDLAHHSLLISDSAYRVRVFLSKQCIEHATAATSSREAITLDALRGSICNNIGGWLHTMPRPRRILPDICMAIETMEVYGGFGTGTVGTPKDVGDSPKVVAALNKLTMQHQLELAPDFTYARQVMPRAAWIVTADGCKIPADQEAIVAAEVERIRRLPPHMLVPAAAGRGAAAAAPAATSPSLLFDDDDDAFIFGTDIVGAIEAAAAARKLAESACRVEPPPQLSSFEARSTPLSFAQHAPESLQSGGSDAASAAPQRPSAPSSAPPSNANSQRVEGANATMQQMPAPPPPPPVIDDEADASQEARSPTRRASNAAAGALDSGAAGAPGPGGGGLMFMESVPPSPTPSSSAPKSQSAPTPHGGSPPRALQPEGVPAAGSGFSSSSADLGAPTTAVPALPQQQPPQRLPRRRNPLLGISMDAMSMAMTAPAAQTQNFMDSCPSTSSDEEEEDEGQGGRFAEAAAGVHCGTTVEEEERDRAITTNTQPDMPDAVAAAEGEGAATTAASWDGEYGDSGADGTAEPHPGGAPAACEAPTYASAAEDVARLPVGDVVMSIGGQDGVTTASLQGESEKRCPDSSEAAALEDELALSPPLTLAGAAAAPAGPTGGPSPHTAVGSKRRRRWSPDEPRLPSAPAMTQDATQEWDHSEPQDQEVGDTAPGHGDAGPSPSPSPAPGSPAAATPSPGAPPAASAAECEQQQQQVCTQASGGSPGSIPTDQQTTPLVGGSGDDCSQRVQGLQGSPQGAVAGATAAL